MHCRPQSRLPLDRNRSCLLAFAGLSCPLTARAMKHVSLANLRLPSGVWCAMRLPLEGGRSGMRATTTSERTVPIRPAGTVRHRERARQEQRKEERARQKRDCQREKVPADNSSSSIPRRFSVILNLLGHVGSILARTAVSSPRREAGGLVAFSLLLTTTKKDPLAGLESYKLGWMARTSAGANREKCEEK